MFRRFLPKALKGLAVFVALDIIGGIVAFVVTLYGLSHGASLADIHPPAIDISLPSLFRAATTPVETPRANANSLVAFTSVNDVIGRFQGAQTITISAFSLGPRSTVTQALVDAAHRGTKVSVVLDGKAFGEAANENAQTVPYLQQNGVRVHLTENPLHIKAAVIDGAVYLSDRNWTTRSSAEIVILDRVPADRMIVERAMLGVPSSNDHLWTRKADALAAEALLLNSKQTRSILVESESFGAGNPVAEALDRRALAGGDLYLIVSRLEYRSSPSERRTLQKLAYDGVHIRIGNSNEKLAINGDYFWAGSANATRGLPDQIDFGLLIQDAQLANDLRQTFVTNWNDATPL